MGDYPTFEGFWNHYQRTLWGFGYRSFTSYHFYYRDGWDEAFSEFHVTLYSEWDTYRNINNAQQLTWACGILRNVFRAFFRRNDKLDGAREIDQFRDELFNISKEEKIGFLRFKKIPLNEIHENSSESDIDKYITKIIDECRALNQRTGYLVLMRQKTSIDDEGVDGEGFDFKELESPIAVLDKSDATKLLEAVDVYLDQCVSQFVVGKRDNMGSYSDVKAAYLLNIVQDLKGNEIHLITGITPPEQVKVETAIKKCIETKARRAGFGEVIEQIKEI